MLNKIHFLLSNSDFAPTQGIPAYTLSILSYYLHISSEILLKTQNKVVFFTSYRERVRRKFTFSYLFSSYHVIMTLRHSKIPSFLFLVSQ